MKLTALIWLMYHLVRTGLYYQHAPYIWGTIAFVVALVATYLIRGRKHKRTRH